VDRQSFFEREREAWARFNSLLGGLVEQEMIGAKVLDDWTVKDILAHIGSWQARVLDSTTRLVAGQRIETIKDFDALNAAQYERDKDLPLAEARARCGANHDRLIDFLQTLSEEQLLGHKLMRAWVTNSTYRHLEEHAGAIAMWRARTTL